MSRQEHDHYQQHNIYPQILGEWDKQMMWTEEAKQVPAHSVQKHAMQWSQP